MKRFLKIFLAVSIIAFAASITAVSCGKTADNNNNANNNSGSGDNGGGGEKPDPVPPPVISIENVNDSVAVLKNGNIELKASGFPKEVIAIDVANTTLAHLANAPADSIKRAFDIVIGGGVTDGSAATGGLILVDTGDKPNANAFTVGAVNSAITSYNADQQKEGLRSVAPRAADAANAEAAKAGWNIYGVFMSDAAPTDAASAASGAAPFSFTTTTGTAATHPVLFCRTTVSTVTSGAGTGTGTVQDDTVLTGGQKASCYVGSVGWPLGDSTFWVDATPGNTFKKKFDIAITGIRTDAKTVSSIGLPGADKALALRDGIDKDDMAALTAASINAYKKMSVTIVKDPGFVFTTPEIKFKNINGGLVKLVPGTGGGIDTIKIKGSALSFRVASDANVNAKISDLWRASTTSFNKLFDITIEGGPAGDATGGLIMVGPGNIASVNDFSDPTSGTTNSGTDDNKREGFMTLEASGGNYDPVGSYFRQAGWNFYGLFMKAAAPTSSDPETSPFAFSMVAGSNSHLFMFCRATISTVTATSPSQPAGLKYTTKFEGAEVAHCWIGNKGTAFKSTQITSWLNTAASATFKKTFHMAIGGFRTDGKMVAQFMPGANNPAKVAAIANGLSSTDVTAITGVNPSAYKKVAVTIVDNANF